jgi:hypothetical protein
MFISLQNPSAELTEFETYFADQLALSQNAQDLLFRRALRANTFTDEQVSDEQVKAIYDLAKWAPTSMNNQPLRIVLVRSPAARDRLVQPLGDGNKAKTAAAPLVAILAADHAFHENLPMTFPHFRRPRRHAHAVSRHERYPAGRVLHPCRSRGRPGCGPDDRLRRCRAERSVLRRQ